MRPAENGGLVLETEEELDLARCTIGAALVPLAEIGGPPIVQELYELSDQFKVNDNNPPITLNAHQTAVLREACEQAKASRHVAVGVLACYKALTRASTRECLEDMAKSKNTLFISTHIVFRTGESPAILSDLMALQGR